MGSFVATLIAIIPYIFYSYNSVPDIKVWNTFLFTFDSKFYESANMFAWVFMSKFLPLYILFIWFFTCRHWWYHALLIPIAMYMFQLFGTINDDVQMMDQFQLKYLLPIMIIVVPSIYLVRAKLFNKMNSDKTLQELEEEFMIRPKNLLERFRDYF